MKIELIKTEYELKVGTKTVYTEIETAQKEITETEYNNIIDSVSFFRRLGGTETIQRAYTSAGYKATKLTSKSPDRQTKVIRKFNFICE